MTISSGDSMPEKVLIAIDALIHAKIDVYYVWNLLVLYTSDKI